MCTYVKTPDIRILIDAGVALGPRFSKLPHPKEYLARNQCRRKIRELAADSDIIIISHYHNDHHTPNYKETVWLGSSAEESEQIYRNKIVIAKDARNAINFSQRRRGWMFQKFVKRIGSQFEVGDGRTFEYGATNVQLSTPVPHGEETSGLGWVIMTTVESRDEKFMHASDVQGPMENNTMSKILTERPHLLIVGGPPVYLAGNKVDQSKIQNAINNASKIASHIPEMIFEHHILRSENWHDDIKPVSGAAAKAGNRAMNAAEYAGTDAQMLESIRPRLYEEDPPSSSFLKWAALPRDRQRQIDPPI
jgi:predicted metallo-beta-lactamase superfamily hydrolase